MGKPGASASASADGAWGPFREAVARVLRPLRREDGLAEERVAAAERRLGLRLPRRLREYYLLAGAWERLNHEFNRLLAPEEVWVEAKAVVFYEEHQGVCFWGIRPEDLDLEDPPVVQADDSRPLGLDWAPSHARVSDFFVTMAYWNAVNGAADHVGVGSPEPHTEALLTSSWPSIPLANGGTSGVKFFGGAGRVVCLDATGTVLQAAAATAEGLREVQDALGIEWDYSTLD